VLLDCLGMALRERKGRNRQGEKGRGREADLRNEVWFQSKTFRPREKKKINSPTRQRPLERKQKGKGEKKKNEGTFSAGAVGTSFSPGKPRDERTNKQRGEGGGAARNCSKNARSNKKVNSKKNRKKPGEKTVP